ncbi:peptidoglycan-associated lipoprotein Pal [Beijerinckia indica]|uniref:Peptidoglycan-associated protein n=1 Tax=Beijerinckia indica subsp. indica (strain ATCC 9039 / DSM 1715 / NCIMB 8712) TaxID=395963 RepID=B2IEL7_BEII9|nr:peptidoglycan-associated lipoprotein Pal [Beijerinckia indica]ACB96957.1 peptidoglycan-associated lipoprotein [Beijerinckia indica subsp. indica ATCC 9039]
MGFHLSARGLKLGAVLGVALAMAACAKNPADDPTALAGYGANGGRGGAASPGSPQDFAVNVGDRVFFESDSSELTQTAQATLDKQAHWLQQYGRYTFTIEGHADERGTREYNFALGARRAEAAKNYLVARGIATSRLRTISYGKERPVATCDDISCWSQNRRAVTVLGAGQS